MEDLYTASRLLINAYEIPLNYESGPSLTLPAGYSLITPLFGNDLQITIDSAEAFREPGFIVFGFIAREDATGRHIAVFRGTRGILEWIQDGRFMKTPNRFERDRGQLALGFAAVASSIKDQPNHQGRSFREVVGTLPQDKPLVGVGHRLGAAIATILAYGTKVKYPELEVHASIVASPLVGDADFAARFVELLAKTSVRLSVTTDLVPMVPPAFLNFRHVMESSETRLPPGRIVKPTIGCWHSHVTYLNLWARLIGATPPALKDECMAQETDAFSIV